MTGYGLHTDRAGLGAAAVPSKFPGESHLLGSMVLSVSGLNIRARMPFANGNCFRGGITFPEGV